MTKYKYKNKYTGQIIEMESDAKPTKTQVVQQARLNRQTTTTTPTEQSKPLFNVGQKRKQPSNNSNVNKTSTQKTLIGGKDDYKPIKTDLTFGDIYKERQNIFANKNLSHDERMSAIKENTAKLNYRKANPLKEDIFGKVNFAEESKLHNDALRNIKNAKNLNDVQKKQAAKKEIKRYSSLISQDADNDVRYSAIKKLNKKQQFAQNHPVLSTGRMMVDPTDMAENMMLEDAARTGKISKNGFYDTSLKTKAKMAGAGAATGASDALMFAVPALSLAGKMAPAGIGAVAANDLAKANRAYKTASALVGTENAVNAGNVLNTVNNVKKAETIAKLARVADSANYGMAFGGLNSAPAYLHGDINGTDVIESMGRMGLLGGVTGALSMPISSGVNKLSGVTNTPLNSLSTGLLDWGAFTTGDYLYGKAKGEEGTLADKATEMLPFALMPFAHAGTQAVAGRLAKPSPVNIQEANNDAALIKAKLLDLIGQRATGDAGFYQDINNRVNRNAFNDEQNFTSEQANALSVINNLSPEAKMMINKLLYRGKIGADAYEMAREQARNRADFTEEQYQNLEDAKKDYIEDISGPPQEHLERSSHDEINAEMDKAMQEDMERSYKNSQEKSAEKDNLSYKDINKANIELQKQAEEAQVEKYQKKVAEDSKIQALKDRLKAKYADQYKNEPLFKKVEVPKQEEPKKTVDHSSEYDPWDDLTLDDLDLDRYGDINYENLVGRFKEAPANNEPQSISRKTTKGKEEPLYDADWKTSEKLSKIHQNKLKVLKKKYNLLLNQETGKYTIVDKKSGKPISTKKFREIQDFFGVRERKNTDNAIKVDEGNYSEDLVAKAEKEGRLADDGNDVFYENYYKDKEKKAEADYKLAADKMLTAEEKVDFYDETNTVHEEEPENLYERGTKYGETKHARFIEDWGLLKTDSSRIEALHTKIEKLSKSKDKGALKEFIQDFTSEAEKLVNRSKMEAERKGQKVKQSPYENASEYLTAALNGKEIKLSGETQKFEHKYSQKEREIIENKWQKIVGSRFQIKDKRSLFGSADRQATYDKYSEKILTDKSLSPKQKEYMIRQLNAAADYYTNNKITEIKTGEYSSQAEIANIINRIEENTKTGNFDESRELINNNSLKYLNSENPLYKRAKQALEEHWQKVTDVKKPMMDDLLKRSEDARNNKDYKTADALFNEAKKIWEQEKKVFSYDVYKGNEAKEQRAIDEIEGVSGTDKRYANKGTGQTWSSDWEQDITKAQREYNKFLDKYENIFNPKEKRFVDNTIDRWFGTDNGFGGKKEVNFEFDKNLGTLKSLAKKIKDNLYKNKDAYEKDAGTISAKENLNKLADSINDFINKHGDKQINFLNSQFRENVSYQGYGGKYKATEALPEKPRIAFDSKGNLYIDPRINIEEKLPKALEGISRRGDMNGVFKSGSFVIEPKAEVEVKTEQHKPLASLDGLDNKVEYNVSSYTDEVVTDNFAKALIKEFFGHSTLRFDDLKGKNGTILTKEDKILLEGKLSGTQRLQTFKHEVKHLLQKIVVKALRAVKGNNAPEVVEFDKVAKFIEYKTKFEKRVPNALKLADSIIELDALKSEGKLTEEQRVEAQNILDKFSRTDGSNALIDYIMAQKETRFSRIETDADLGKGDDYSLFGKDINEYKEIIDQYRQLISQRTNGSLSGFEKTGEGKGNDGNGTSGTAYDGIRQHGGFRELDLDDISNVWRRPDRSRRDSVLKDSSSVRDVINQHLGQFKDVDVDKLVKKYNGDLKKVREEIGTPMRKLAGVMEEWSLDDGLTFEKQALNRRSQLSGKPKQDDKSAVFIPQKRRGQEKPYEKIDLTRDYNIEEESAKKGVRLSTEESALNLFTHALDVGNHHELMNLIKEKASRPVGTVGGKGSWTAVNHKLYSRCIFDGMSRDFYETIRKGPDAIKKAFKNEKELQYAMDLYNEFKGDDYEIPTSLYKDMLRGQRETAKQAFDRYRDINWKYAYGKSTSKIVGGLLKPFKLNVLSTAKFLLHNRDNLQKIVTDLGVRGFAEAVLEAKNIPDVYIPKEVLSYSINEAVDNATKRTKETGWNTFDNMVAVLNGNLIETKNLKKIIKATNDKGESIYKENDLKNRKRLLATAYAANAFNVATMRPLTNKLANAIFRTNQKIEAWERKVQYVGSVKKLRSDLLKNTTQQMASTKELCKHLKEHPELEDVAINRVEDVLGNYRSFTNAEKNWVKNIIPFVSYQRHVLRNTYYMMKTNPTRFLLLKHLFDEIADDNDKKGKTEWQRYSIDLPIKDKRNGKNLVFNIDPYLMPTLKKPGKEGLAHDILEEGMWSVNPWAKDAYTLATGKKINGAPINSSRYVWNSKKKKYYDTKEKTFVDKLPFKEKAKALGVSTARTYAPIVGNRMLGIEPLSVAIKNKLSGKRNDILEPDRMSDTELFDGWYNGDYHRGYKRKVTTQDSEGTKILKRFGDFYSSADKNYYEKKRDAEKIKRQQEKMKKKKKKA